MAKAIVSDRIAKLKARREQLDARLNALEQKEKAESRKLDARRKIVVGGAVLAHMEKDDGFAQLMRSLLAASVGRQNDRAVIADLLAPAPTAAPQPAAMPEPQRNPESAAPSVASALDALDDLPHGVR